MKIARTVFAVLTMLLLICALVDGRHRRSLYEGPFLFPELICAGITVMLSQAVKDRPANSKNGQ